MTTTRQKQEIVESLNNLDVAQSEKVLQFIKTLNHRHQGEVKNEHGKKVMKEINLALTRARLWI